MAVIAAVELDEDASLRCGARQAERAHGGLGSGRNEPEPFRRRIEALHAVGKLDLEGRRRPVERSLAGLPLHRLDDVGVRVPQE